MHDNGFEYSAMLAPLLLLLLGLVVTVVIDPYITRKNRRVMLVVVGLCLSLIVQNLWENELFVRHSNLALKYLISAYGYSARPVILILFLYIIEPGERKWPLWAFAGINAILYFTSPVTKLCIDIREFDYASLKGPLWFACFAISAAFLVKILVATVSRYREVRKHENAILLFSVLVIIVSVVLDMNVGMNQQPITFLTIAIIVSSVFYYIWLHLQFVRDHERDLMAAQRIQIMMTQIQPHFLFNALNTIRALYAKDPPLADRTLENFSSYLRQNLESLSQTDLLPLSKEMEHTRLYAEIETLRFPNVQVEYHIEDESFRLPALTIQPLVENAIRHGVRGRGDGHVIVATAYKNGVHRVTIEDNGVGFDPEQQNPPEKSHIGLKNVRDRVEQMCGGTMIVKSEPGKGTAVTLLIPDPAPSGKKERRK